MGMFACLLGRSRLFWHILQRCRDSDQSSNSIRGGGVSKYLAFVTSVREPCASSAQFHLSRSVLYFFVEM